jgi:hypothetical protein
VPIKVKTRLFLKDMPKDIKKNFSKGLKSEIGDIIKGKILRGESPVKGYSFVKYSDSYAKLKGRKKPVDMLVTGEMLESLTVRQNRLGQVLIYFKSKIAKWHDSKKARVERRLLPSRKGEVFKRDVMKEIKDILRRAVKTATRKQN